MKEDNDNAKFRYKNCCTRQGAERFDRKIRTVVYLSVNLMSIEKDRRKRASKTLMVTSRAYCILLEIKTTSNDNYQLSKVLDNTKKMNK